MLARKERTDRVLAGGILILTCHGVCYLQANLLQPDRWEDLTEVIEKRVGPVADEGKTRSCLSLPKNEQHSWDFNDQSCSN